MGTDPSQLMALLSQNSGLAGQYFLNGQDQARKQQTDDQNYAINAAKLADVQRQAANDADFQADWTRYLKDPTTDALARIAVKYPTHADAVKEFWAIKDPEQRQSHINAIAPIVSSLQNNRPDLALTSLKQLRDATAQSGQPTADLDQEIEALRSGDKEAINAVKGTMMMHLASADPDGKFADSLARAKKAFEGDPYTLGAGDTRYDGGNNVVARGAPKQMEPFHYTLKDKAGNDHEYIYDPNSGQPMPQGAVPVSGASGAAALAPDGHLDPVAFYKQFVLPHEGGYAPHDANGAPVNHGINQSANPGVDVKNLTEDQAAQIFASKYFPPSAGLPPALAAVNADTAFINPTRAAQFLKASGGDAAKYMTMRQAWMNSLIRTQPDKYAKYAKAWNSRNADLSAYAQNLGGGAAPGPAPGGAPASGGMPSAQIGGSRQIDPNPVDNSLGNDAPGDATKTGEAYLATVPGGIRATVKAIASGQMAQPSSFALTKPYWQQIMAAVPQYDPTFNSSTQPTRVAAAKAFTGNGKAAQTVASIDRLAYHMNDLYRDSQALVGWDLGPASGFVNGGLQSFQKAALARYNATLPFIAGELQKLTKNGSATVEESKQIMANLAPSQPASARLAAFQQLAELAQGQFKPIREQWQSAFPDGRPMPMDVAPETDTIFDHINNDKGPVAVDGKTGKIIRTNAQGASRSSAPPSAAVNYLRANPNTRAQFDAKYGAGSSAKALGR